jgi:hypothetical protein
MKIHSIYYYHEILIYTFGALIFSQAQMQQEAMMTKIKYWNRILYWQLNMIFGEKRSFIYVSSHSGFMLWEKWWIKRGKWRNECLSHIL